MEGRIRCSRTGPRWLLAALTVVAATSSPLTAVEPAAGMEPLFLNFVRPPMHYTTPPHVVPGERAFSITLNFTGGLSAEEQEQFTIARDRWESRITGYQPGIGLSGITINASGTYMDGPGGVLGSAGPTFFTVQNGYSLTTQGQMQFDTGDIPNLMANGSFDDVIEHEMGHVLGIGVWWGENAGYVDGSGEYTGAEALAAYRAEFVGQSGATSVPVELQGGAGTADGHWDEVYGGGGLTGIVDALGNDMRNELMTGWLNMPTFYSNTTHRSLVDMGFAVTSTGPTGACCLPSGACSELESGSCLSAGGAYHGDGTTCAEVTCPLPDFALDQAPNEGNGLFSDPDCDFCGSGLQSIADNFTVAVDLTITQVILWGGYYPDNIPSATDDFTVIFHADASGLPGASVASQSGVASTRAGTGVQLFGVDEHRFTLTLSPAVELSPGTYWVEIFNDTAGNTDSFFWETGNLDTGRGVYDSVADTSAVPGSTWGSNGGEELAVRLVVSPAAEIFADGFEGGNTTGWSSVVD